MIPLDLDLIEIEEKCVDCGKWVKLRVSKESAKDIDLSDDFTCQCCWEHRCEEDFRRKAFGMMAGMPGCEPY